MCRSPVFVSAHTRAIPATNSHTTCKSESPWAKVSFLSLHTSSISDRYPSRYDSFRHSMNFTRFANCSAAISHSGFGHCLVNTNSCWAIRSKSCIRRQRFPKYRPYVAIHRVALICARFTNSLCILIPRTAFFALCFTCASYSILLRRASCWACFTCHCCLFIISLKVL